MNTSLAPTTTVEAVKEQVSCDLNGEAAILHLEQGVYYGLDPVGARVWALIQEPRTLDELHALLLREYEVDGGRLQKDLVSLLADLERHGLVRLADSAQSG